MRDPAFLFFSSDFLTGVADLTFEERGQYITLLCLHHQKGRLSKKIIDMNCPNVSKDVLSKFCIDENGLYYNKRLEFESNKRKEHAEKQRDRATKGWEKRKKSINNGNSFGNAVADAVALPLEIENENRIRDINTEGIENFIFEIKDKLDPDFYRYLRIRYQLKNPIQLKPEFASKTNCYFILVQAIPLFGEKIKFLKDKSEGAVINGIKEWLKFNTVKKANVEWNNYLDMAQHCINYIDLQQNKKQ